MEDKIPIIQVLDPRTKEEIITMYNFSHPNQLTHTSRMPLSEVLERYGDILIEEQKTKLRNCEK